jgi:hypothetical protein
VTLPAAPAACPDWQALAAHRAGSRLDPPGWEEAVRHLDGCPRCRPQALAADPTLVFRRLPAPVVGADEIAAMQLRVAALRGASGLGGPVASRASRPLWRRVAVAAALVAAVLTADQAPPLAAGRSALVAHRALAAELHAQPVLEELNQPFDNVVQWNGDDLSVVWVLDERLDV